MINVRNKIVIAQRIWSNDTYIVFYDNGEVVAVSSLDEDEALGQFVRECTTSGCVKVVTIPIFTGTTTIKCKQSIYSMALQVTPKASFVEAATGMLAGIAKGSIQYVIWNPSANSLHIQDSPIGPGKNIYVDSSMNVPTNVSTLMVACAKNGETLKRVFQSTITKAGRARVETVTEFLFTMKAVPRTFRGAGVDQASDEELQELGFRF